MIYLDHAAATPLDSEVFTAMKPYFADKFYNPSATYLSGRSVAHDIQRARQAVAACLGVRSAEIIFTAGGTEANNLAIRGVMELFPEANCVISALEHDSVRVPAGRYQVYEAHPLPSGEVDIDDIAAHIDDTTVLISVMYANNEIGTIQPIAEICRLAAAVREERTRTGNRLPLYVHTDAAQAGNYLHLLANRLGVDMMTLNAGKLYGPKQSGVLYAKAGTRLAPQILGGGQERHMRSGTENSASIMGLAKALEKAQALRTSESKRLNALKKYFLKQLSEKVPDAGLTVISKHVLPNNIHITVPGQDNERLMMALDEAGIVCAVGSACSASSDEPSHVLKALGMSDEEARSSLRFTMGRGTRETDIDKTVAALAGLIESA